MKFVVLSQWNLYIDSIASPYSILANKKKTSKDFCGMLVDNSDASVNLSSYKYKPNI